MKSRELVNLGIPRGEPLQVAKTALAAAAEAGFGKQDLRNAMRELTSNPRAYTEHEIFGALAKSLLDDAVEQKRFVARAEPAPYKKWGKNLDEGSIDQMRNACALPVAVQGALMPDAHVGYGLPIGGVLATKDAVIPYAVGVDIACRMKMSVLDLPVGASTGQMITRLALPQAMPPLFSALLLTLNTATRPGSKMASAKSSTRCWPI